MRAFTSLNGHRSEPLLNFQLILIGCGDITQNYLIVKGRILLNLIDHIYPLNTIAVIGVVYLIEVVQEVFSLPKDLDSITHSAMHEYIYFHVDWRHFLNDCSCSYHKDRETASLCQCIHRSNSKGCTIHYLCKVLVHNLYLGIFWKAPKHLYRC